jgi:O-methyltransferase
VSVSRRDTVANLEAQLEFRRDLHRRTIDELQGWVSQAEPSWPEPSLRRSELLVDLLGTETSEALYIVAELHACLALDGAVAEFGVAQGATSAVIAGELAGSDKQLWLFDSFLGLPRPTAEDTLVDDIFELGSMEAYEGTMAVGAHEVVRRLTAIAFPLERAKIVSGFVEETLEHDELPIGFCFAYVDLDFYRPIKTVLEFMANRLARGGVVVVDDYGHFSGGAQQAVDEFARDHASSFSLSLPRSWAGNFALLERV